jgi:hypothetical protein
MADAFQVLYQGQMLTTVDEFFAIASMCIVKHIKMFNVGSTIETVELYIGGTATANKWHTVVLGAGESAEWYGSLSLSTAKTLRGKTTTATTVNMVVSGDAIA